MCSQYTLKTRPSEIAEKFDIDLDFLVDEIDIRPQGFLKTHQAPVVVAEDDAFAIKDMYFSLCPSWSKEFPSKWSTYNARLERPKVGRDKKPVLDKKGKAVSEFIYEIPTWRESFKNGLTCLVPMTAAVESSYFGTHAGNIIQFSAKDSEIFYCAGIWSQWMDIATGEEKESFALLTDDPYEFFFKAGHDRSVIVVGEKAGRDWLSNKDFDPKERFDFLRKNRVNLDWKVEGERQMAKGWQKRAPSKDEISAIRIFR